MAKKIKYDYLIVGSGLFGSTFAYHAHKAGKLCMVIDKRTHSGGNIYCENKNGINIHKYGPHIFHTSNKAIWDFVNQFVAFNNYKHAPLATRNGQLFNLPFNMNTFNQLWGVTTVEAAQKKIYDRAIKAVKEDKRFLEEILKIERANKELARNFDPRMLDPKFCT